MGLALSAAGPAAAQPSPTIQLAVLLDGSVSVNATEWNTQISGLRDAILDPSCVPHDGSVELTVIQFGGDLTSEGPPPSYNPGAVVYFSTQITSANAGSVAETVDTIIRNDQFYGSTPLHEGILAAIDEIGGANAIAGARQIINISTDGGTNRLLGLPRDLAEQARDDAIADEIDEISAEGLGDIITGPYGENNADWLKDRIVHPGYPAGSGKIAPPFTPGWVYLGAAQDDGIQNAAEFTEAIGHKIPRYTLTVNSSGGGSVAKDPNQATYTYGTNVQLTATADPGWTFSAWSGDLTGSTNPDDITMDSDKTVTANFSEQTPLPTPTPTPVAAVPDSRRTVTPEPFEVTVTPGVSESTFAFSSAETVDGIHSVKLGVINLQNEQEGIKIGFRVQWDKYAPKGEGGLQNIDASSISLKVKGDVLYDGVMARSPYPLIVIDLGYDAWISDGAVRTHGELVYFYPTDASGSVPEITVSGDPTSEWATVIPAYPQYWKAFFLDGQDMGEVLNPPIQGPTDLVSWHEAMSARLLWDRYSLWDRYRVKYMGVGYGFVSGGSTVYVDDLAVKAENVDQFIDYDVTYDFEPGASGGGCFIATAAYGSYLDSHVETLRDFRDSYLLANPVGSALVSLYYKLSPPVAEFIDDHPALKPVVRVGLLPAVAMGTVAVNTTSAQKVAIVGSLLLVSALAVVWMRRRRGKGSEYS